MRGGEGPLNENVWSAVGDKTVEKLSVNKFIKQMPNMLTTFITGRVTGSQGWAITEDRRKRSWRGQSVTAHPRNAVPLTKHRRCADRKGVIVSVKVLRSDCLVRVLLKFIPILINDCHGDVARRRDRQQQLGLGNLVENDRQVVLQVEPRPGRPNDHEGRSIRRKQRSRSDLIGVSPSDRTNSYMKKNYLMSGDAGPEAQVEVWKGKTCLKSFSELCSQLMAPMTTYISQVQGQDSARRGEQEE